MTDTGSYKYSNTSPESHEISARLIEFGIKPYEVYQEVYEKLSVPAALIAARAHGTLEIEDGISCITITQKMLEETGATPEDTHDIVSYGRAIDNIEVALLFRETENDIKVSLRSTHRIDVNKIAVGFNGGGHLRAAGCNIEGTMEEVKAKVFAAVREALTEANSAQQTDGQ
jgi:phosphoesterase RecJ-like protein